MLLQNLDVPFSIDGAVTDMYVAHAMGTNTPPYHHRSWLLNFALVTIWMVFFLFCPEDTTAMISKYNLTVCPFQMDRRIVEKCAVV